jgi:hypothetical protein
LTSASGSGGCHCRCRSLAYGSQMRRGPEYG